MALTEDLPGENWIRQALSSFVRDEFGGRQQPAPRSNLPSLPVVIEQHYLPADYLTTLAKISEDIPKIVPTIPSFPAPEEMLGGIFDILCTDECGSKKNRLNNDRTAFIRATMPVLAAEGRLLFAMLGFPFKDQNRLRVPFSARFPDVGEASMMLRLHRLTQAIYQLHPFGADVLILTDGHLYADIFGVDPLEVAAYRRRLIAYRNAMNLSGTVSIIDLSEVLDIMGEAGVRVRSFLVDFITTLRCNGELPETFASLDEGMLRNLANQDVLAGFSAEEAFACIYAPEAITTSRVKRARGEIESRARHASIEYAAVNLTLRHLRVIDVVFPEAIRATVHAKPGQFCLTGSGNGFVWNGVAYVSRAPRSLSDIKSAPFCFLTSPALQQYLFFDDAPAFYAPMKGC